MSMLDSFAHGMFFTLGACLAIALVGALIALVALAIAGGVA